LYVGDTLTVDLDDVGAVFCNQGLHSGIFRQRVHRESANAHSLRPPDGVTPELEACARSAMSFFNAHRELGRGYAVIEKGKTQLSKPLERMLLASQRKQLALIKVQTRDKSLNLRI